MSNVIGAGFFEVLSGGNVIVGGRLRYLFAFLFGGISVLALSPFQFWPILLLSLPALLILLDNECSRERVSNSLFSSKYFRAALIGWLFGFGYFVAGLYWMGHAFLVEADRFAIFMPFAVLAMPAFLAFFYALAVLPVSFVYGPYSRFFALVLGFGVAEWIRGHVLTGFPWNAIGYGLTAEGAMMQLASVVGLYGLNFLAVFFFASPYVLIARSRDRRGFCLNGLVFFGFVAVVLVGVVVWGGLRLSMSHYGGHVDGVKLRLVQPNVPQEKKMDLQYVTWNFEQLVKHSGGNPNQIKSQGITHIIWPEVAVRLLLARDEHAQKEIADLLPEGVNLITGSVRIKTEGGQQKAYNSLLVFDDKARVQAIYDKKHLVPFGEYLPLKSVLSRIGFEHLTRQAGGFQQGAGPRWLTADNIPAFSPLICYEVVFPDAMYEEGKRPGWLLNVTNDAWFGDSTGPHQHFHMARVRAVEEGLPVIRVANTGISGVIDAVGVVQSRLPYGVEGAIDYRLPKALEATLYAQYRGLIFPVFFGVFLVLMFVLNRRKL